MSVRVLVGDCRSLLATLPEKSVQTCVTSPPYFGLRDYGVAGQIGLEATPDAFVAELVAVFREVRRVLRDDGTLWLNLGDSYASSGVSGRQSATANLSRHGANGHNPKMREQVFGRAPTPEGLKAKDLLGIPWRVAFALQSDGWYLRSDIIWHKPNPMPESVTDRPTKAHEYLFLLSKSPTYYYDADAIAEAIAPATLSDARDGMDPRRPDIGFPGSASRGSTRLGNAPTRNRRTVWTVATQPYSGAHFATFPPALIEPCILAGSAKQACETCGAPLERVVERGPLAEQGDNPGKPAHLTPQGYNRAGKSRCGVNEYVTERGFAPTCDCETNTGAGRSVVLDPFGGAGTTGLVADRLGRDAILCELNPQYAELARRRITDDAPLFGDVA